MQNRDGASKQQSINTKFLEEAQKGNVKQVTNLLRQKADIEAVGDPEEEHALHLAAFTGHLDLTYFLLRQKALVDAKNRLEQTPLHFAAMGGHAKLAEVLLKHKAYIEMPDWLRSRALHKACEMGKIDAAHTLLQHKAKIDPKDPWDQTPLHFATLNKHWNVVALLTRSKADIDAINSQGQTPIMIADEQGDMTSTHQLFKHGAKLGNKDGIPPLHWTIEHAYSLIMSILLEKKADPNEPDANGVRPLQLAAQKSSSTTIGLLLGHKADISVVTDKRWTLLHIAAQKGQVRVASVLIDHKVDIAATNEQSITALHLAAQGANTQLVELLLERGADPLAMGPGVTPFDLLIKNEKRSHVKQHERVLTKLAGSPLMRVWGGKHTPPGSAETYTPVAAKTDGSAPGFIAKNASKSPCMIKLGWPDRRSPVSATVRSERSRSKLRSEIKSVQEKIAADAFGLLGQKAFYAAKHRLAKLKAINEYSRLHSDTEYIVNDFFNWKREAAENRIERCAHLVSIFVEGYKDLGLLRDCFVDQDSTEKRSFIQWLGRGILPSYVRIKGRMLKLVGLEELLAVSRLMADTDILGGRADNAGFVLEHDEKGEPVAARVVKIDAGESYTFSGRDNLFLSSFYPVREGKEPQDPKDLQWANKQPFLIKWHLLRSDQKDRFLSTLKRGLSILRRKGVMDLLIHRKGLFDQTRGVPGKKLLTSAFITNLKKGWLDYLALQEREDVYGELLRTTSDELQPDTLPYNPKTHGVANYTMQEVESLLQESPSV